VGDGTLVRRNESVNREENPNRESMAGPAAKYIGYPGRTMKMVWEHIKELIYAYPAG
jgi:hypothetical protein